MLLRTLCCLLALCASATAPCVQLDDFPEHAEVVDACPGQSSFFLSNSTSIDAVMTQLSSDLANVALTFDKCNAFAPAYMCASNLESCSQVPLCRQECETLHELCEVEFQLAIDFNQAEFIPDCSVLPLYPGNYSLAVENATEVLNWNLQGQVCTLLPPPPPPLCTEWSNRPEELALCDPFVQSTHVLLGAGKTFGSIQASILGTREQFEEQGTSLCLEQLTALRCQQEFSACVPVANVTTQVQPPALPLCDSECRWVEQYACQFELAFLQTEAERQALTGCSGVELNDNNTLANCRVFQRAVLPPAPTKCPTLWSNCTGAIAGSGLPLGDPDNSVCCLDCPLPLFSDSKMMAVFRATNATGFIGFFMLGFTVLTFCLQRWRLKYPAVLITLMLIGQWITDIALIWPTLNGVTLRDWNCKEPYSPLSRLFDEEDGQTGVGIDDAACSAQSALLLIFSNASLFYFVSACIQLFVSAGIGKRHISQQPWVRISLMVTPMALGFIYFIVAAAKDIQNQDPGQPFCFLRVKQEVGTELGLNVITHTITTSLTTPMLLYVSLIAVRSTNWKAFVRKRGRLLIWLFITTYVVGFSMSYRWSTYADRKSTARKFTNYLVCSLASMSRADQTCNISDIQSLSYGPYFASQFNTTLQAVLGALVFGFNAEVFQWWKARIHNLRTGKPFYFEDKKSLSYTGKSRERTDDMKSGGSSAVDSSTDGYGYDDDDEEMQ